VRIDDNVLDRLIVTRTDDLLTVRLEDGSYNNLTLVADITLPDLTYLDISGASSVQGIN
jgi:hypothetical protein